jgi:putative ABC transport system permease protein
MIAHGLLALYRSLSRHRLYAALNVLGLAAGIAVFLVLLLVVQYERSFDRWLPKADQTYRLDSTFFNPGQPSQEGAYASFVALPLLRADYKQIIAGARIMGRTDPVAVGSLINNEDIGFVDPSFLDVVELPLVAGDRATALASPSSIAITETVARKYFDTTKALGRTLDITHEGAKRSYTVGAIIADLPKNTTLQLQILVPLTPTVEQDVPAFSDWGSSSGQTYLRLRTQAEAHAMEADLPNFLDRRAAGTGDTQLGAKPRDGLVLSLIRLPEAHFHDVAVDADVPGADPRVVYSLGLVGLLALITAAINYVNLATARSGLRAREVALRKVTGATRSMLLRQFLGEAVALVAVAALIGLALSELAIPMVNTLQGWALQIKYAEVIPLLAVLVVLVGLGAGAYPAILLANYRPAAVLASARAPAGGRLGTRLRAILVVAQFASAIGFAICTLVIDRQAAFLSSADRGFDRNGLIIVASLRAAELQSRQLTILDALRRVPGVTAATLSDREPDSNNNSDTSVSRAGLVGAPPVLVSEVVGADYLPSYGVHLLAGRWFDAAHGQDDSKSLRNTRRMFSVAINLGAVHALGFADAASAIGQQFSRGTNAGRPVTIIGVVGDVRFKSPREPVGPQFYMYDSGPINYAQGAIRFAGVPSREMMTRLQAAWRASVPDYPFDAKTADARLADFYQPDQRRAQLLSAGAVLAVAIACVGLYGLASFSTARRMKEIGIRKVLGASTRDVLVLLVGQFVRPVLIANVIAWPIAWAVMRGWLAGFDQRIALSPLYFLAASAGALLIAMGTVLGQAWRVARAEPARALRYE